MKVSKIQPVYDKIFKSFYQYLANIFQTFTKLDKKIEFNKT
jgi:hypothetical protein